MSRIKEKLRNIRQSYVDGHAFDSGAKAYLDIVSEEIVNIQQEHRSVTPHDDPYFVGMYNGMEFANSIIMDLGPIMEPNFMEIEKSKDTHNYKYMIEEIVTTMNKMTRTLDFEMKINSIIGADLIKKILDKKPEECNNKTK